MLQAALGVVVFGDEGGAPPVSPTFGAPPSVTGSGSSMGSASLVEGAASGTPALPPVAPAVPPLLPPVGWPPDPRVPSLSPPLPVWEAGGRADDAHPIITI